MGLGPDIRQTTKLERIIIPKLLPFSKSPKKNEDQQNEEEKEEKDEMLYTTLRRRFDSLRKNTEKSKKEVVSTEEEDSIVSIEAGPIISGAITSIIHCFI